MTIREEQRDLFSVPQGYYLAHCISADYALGAGIAKQFRDIYNMRTRLKKDYPLATGLPENMFVGQALPVANVYNLVTKTKAFQKPTYESVRAALEDMRDDMLENYKSAKGYSDAEIKFFAPSEAPLFKINFSRINRCLGSFSVLFAMIGTS